MEKGEKHGVTDRLKGIVCDCAKAFGIGFLVAGAFGLAVFLIVLLCMGFSLSAASDAAMSSAFALMALVLFLLAGMLLVKGKKPEEYDEKNGWRRHFRVVGVKLVMAFIALGILIVGAALDFLRLTIH